MHLFITKQFPQNTLEKMTRSRSALCDHRTEHREGAASRAICASDIGCIGSSLLSKKHSFLVVFFNNDS